MKTIIALFFFIYILILPVYSQNDAQFISQTISREITAGESFVYTVKIRNTGTTTWTQSGHYNLGTQAPQDNFQWLPVNRISLPYDVSPGDTVTFSATLTAPEEEGVYAMQWQMVEDGVEWFGERTRIIPFINYSDPNTFFTYTLPSYGNIYDEALAAACLQGIINRDGPKVYVLEGNGKLRPQYWLDILSSNGRWLSNRPRLELKCIEELVALAGDKIKGSVIWDPNVAASMNIATTIAGVEDLVVFSPEYAAMNLKAWGLDIVKDLRGMFTGELSGSAKNDAYRWAINEYLSQGVCSDHLLCYFEDPYLTRSGGDIGYVVTRDRAITNRAFVYDLSPWGDETPLDDPDQPLGTDLETYHLMLQEILDHTAGEKTTEVAGFFSFKKYSNVEGHPSSHDPVPTEWETVYLISPYNCYQNTVASSCYNQSFHSQAPFTNLNQNRPADTLSLEEGKTYVCILMADYDSGTPLYDFLVDYWPDPQRGSLPLMWGIDPNLVESYPDLISYYYETQTENDYFAADASAAGYMNPNRVQEEYLPLFINHNRKFYDMLDMTISPMVLDWDEPTDAVKDAFLQFSPDGFATIVMDLHNTGGKSPEPHIWKGMPVTNLLNMVGQISDINTAADAMSRAMPEQSPGTTSFYIFRIVWSWPNQVIDVLNILKNNRTDLDIQVVDPYNFFNLFKESLAGTPVFDNTVTPLVTCRFNDHYNTLIIQTQKGEVPEKAEIYSMEGRLLKSLITGFDEIPAGDLHTGNIYLVRIFLENKVIVKKIIKPLN
jgi:hypothetical protein